MKLFGRRMAIVFLIHVKLCASEMFAKTRYRINEPFSSACCGSGLGLDSWFVITSSLKSCALDLLILILEVSELKLTKKVNHLPKVTDVSKEISKT